MPYSHPMNGSSSITVFRSNDLISANNHVRFSGHVYMESVYSINNKITLVLQANEQNALFDTFISAVYEVMVLGEVYSEFNMVNQNSLELLPFSTLLTRKLLIYRWYFANKIYPEGKKIMFWSFKISLFKCRNSESAVLLYAGLVSLFTAHWKNVLEHVYKCSIDIQEQGKPFRVYHMYSTVLLKIPGSIPGTRLTMKVLQHRQRFKPRMRNNMGKSQIRIYSFLRSVNPLIFKSTRLTKFAAEVEMQSAAYQSVYSTDDHFLEQHVTGRDIYIVKYDNSKLL